MAANGEEEEDTHDQGSSYYSETIVIPSQEVHSKTINASAPPHSAKATANKVPASKPTVQKTASRPAAPATMEPQPSEVIRRNKKIAIISISAVTIVLVLCVCIGVWFYFASTADNGLIMDNTYAAGLNIGGLTPEDAKALLCNAADDTFGKQSLVISLPDATLELSPEDTHVKLDIDLLVADAYQYGREGSRSERVAAMAAAAMSKREINLLSYMTLDTTYIENAINQLLADTSSTLTQPSIKIDGARPTAAIPESEAAATEVFQTLTVTIGTRGRTFDANAVYDQVLTAYSQNDFSTITVEYTIEEPEKVDLTALIEEYCSDPVDAQLNTEDYTVSDEVWGYGFNTTAAENLLNAAADGEIITLSLTYLAPDMTRTELENTLFQDVLASAETPYYYHPDRTTNLTLACEAINGLIIKPGETFSFNETLGERTAEKGYKPAGAYVNGETVNQVGGGICQVASTLYYCTLYADLEIVEREEHMYTADYLPLGMDATVNWGTLDFCFRNDTDKPIRIDAKTEDGYVYITLYGTDDKDYYVEMDFVILEELQWETVEKEMDEDNEKGYTDGEVIQSGWMGYIVDTYKYKYDKETDEQISCTLESHSEYSKRDKLVCKIKKPTEATTIPPTTDAPETTVPPTETETPTEAPTEVPTEVPSEATQPPADTSVSSDGIMG